LTYDSATSLTAVWFDYQVIMKFTRNFTRITFSSDAFLFLAKLQDVFRIISANFNASSNFYKLEVSSLIYYNKKILQHLAEASIASHVNNVQVMLQKYNNI